MRRKTFLEIKSLSGKFESVLIGFFIYFFTPNNDTMTLQL